MADGPEIASIAEAAKENGIFTYLGMVERSASGGSVYCSLAAIHPDGRVATLDTRLTPAPATGTPLFSLVIEAHVPTKLPVAKLRSELEEIAAEENLDLELRALA